MSDSGQRCHSIVRTAGTFVTEKLPLMAVEAPGRALDAEGSMQYY